MEKYLKQKLRLNLVIKGLLIIVIMPLSVREYVCLSCGIKNDRDYNSAIVLKTAGMSVLKACGAALV